MKLNTKTRRINIIPQNQGNKQKQKLKTNKSIKNIVKYLKKNKEGNFQQN